MKLSEPKPLRKSPRKFRGNGCIVIPSVARNLTIEVGTTQNNMCEATSCVRSFASLRSIDDGGAIPLYQWSGMGGTFEGRYRNASVLHDVAYGEKKRTWQGCHRMFYFAMRGRGVSPVEDKAMFYAVYKFGHHWRF